MESSNDDVGKQLMQVGKLAWPSLNVKGQDSWASEVRIFSLDESRLDYVAASQQSDETGYHTSHWILTISFEVFQFNLQEIKLQR